MRQTSDLIELTKAGESLCEPGFIDRMLAQPEVAEDDLVQRVVEFANRGTLAAWINVQEGLSLPSQGGEPPSPGIQAEHFRVRSALSAIVRKRVSPERAEAWRRIAAGVLQVENRYRVVEQYVGTEPSGLFAVVLRWHLDPERRFGADLCQCRLERCGKFFFAVKGAHRPTRRYCPGTDHMAEADAEKASERMRKSRESKKQRARLPRRQRTKQ